MSLINVFVSDDAALIGFDTEGRWPDGRFSEVGKTLALPHIGAMLAFRGEVLTFTGVSGIVSGFPGDFDALSDAMGGILSEAIRMIIAGGLDKHNAALAEVILVGYSPKAERIVGHFFKSTTPDSGVEESRDFPQYYSPFFGFDEIKKLGIVADRKGMKALALSQYSLVRERVGDDSPIGGRLFIAEVRKGGISIDDAMAFPPRKP